MRTLVLLAVAIISLAAADLPFKPASDYSCSMVMAGGAQAGKGRMVVGKQGTRVEMAGPQGSMVMIMRKDEKVMHMLMVDMKMVMDMPVQKQAFQDPTADPNASWTKTGSETVNGVACDRYDWKGSNGFGTAWIDPARKVMIRVTDGQGKGQVDFSDYKLGAQADSDFTVPADYKPFNPAAFGGQ